jgi:hypothetical protein
MTLVSGLFNSCATPATSCPIAESFSACGAAPVAFRRLDGRDQAVVGGGELVAHLLHAPGVLDLDRHVLRDLHDRGAVGGIDHRTGRHAEDPVAGTGDFFVDAGAAGGPADGALRKRTAAEPDLVAREAAQRGHGPAQVRRQRRVAAEEAPVAVEDRDRVAHRVERGLPFLLAGADEGVQPRVLHADGHLVRDDPEEPLVLERKASRFRGADGQHADQILAG